MTISIIIPVFNEKDTVSELITKVKNVKFNKGIVKEIVVVDDTSTDGTTEILKKIKGIKLYFNKNNKGKGATVVKGIKKSKGEVIIIQDADLEYNPSDFPRLIKPIIKKQTKVVYGSRLKNYPLRLVGKKRTPLVTHFLGNKFLTVITNLLYRKAVTDMETGYKVFTRDVWNNIGKIKAKRFDFEPEFTAKILKKGYKIIEVPIKVDPRGYDEGKKISWKDGFVALWTLVKYRFID